MTLDYNGAVLIIVTMIGTVFFAIAGWYEYRKKLQIRFWHDQPLEERYRRFLPSIPHYIRLGTADQKSLEQRLNVFIHTKIFTGIGVTITDEMKTLIGFYACLLLLRKPQEYCYDTLKTIIVYPSAVRIDTLRSNGGVYTQDTMVIEGQSTGEAVVITWHEAKKEAYHMHRQNVILHEFAHEIDGLDGRLDGIPPIETSKFEGWVHILYKELDTLGTIAWTNRGWGKYKLFGEYAATNEAEMFAVATERFFESPNTFRRDFPEFYHLLADFYEMDSATLFGSATPSLKE
ncbi:MAG: zinc-dependent peptidase [Sulfuricurvum sp.]